MRTCVCLAWLSAALTACTAPAMKLDNRLAGMAPMHVHGRQGWQIDQVISFGEFRTGPVKRSWNRGYDYPFVIRFTGAKEKLAFNTVDGSGLRAEINCAGKLSEQDFHKFEQYFDINLRTRDVFTCTVATGDGRGYDFFANDLNQNRSSGTVTGTIRGADLNLSIRPVWQLEKGHMSWDTRPMGLEFVDGSTVVGAIETLNQGRVWLDSALSPEQGLVLAGVASALLLRSHLADHND